MHVKHLKCVGSIHCVYEVTKVVMIRRRENPPSEPSPLTPQSQQLVIPLNAKSEVVKWRPHESFQTTVTVLGPSWAVCIQSHPPVPSF